MHCPKACGQQTGYMESGPTRAVTRLLPANWPPVLALKALQVLPPTCVQCAPFTERQPTHVHGGAYTKTLTRCVQATLREVRPAHNQDTGRKRWRPQLTVCSCQLTVTKSKTTLHTSIPDATTPLSHSSPQPSQETRLAIPRLTRNFQKRLYKARNVRLFLPAVLARSRAHPRPCVYNAAVSKQRRAIQPKRAVCTVRQTSLNPLVGSAPALPDCHN